MPSVLFYERPVALDRQVHRELKIKAGPQDFSFAKKTNAVPLACVEFPRAALAYPIVFAGPSEEAFMPVAMLGIREGQNLFVDEKGVWTGNYIPAFVRRYPFVLAEKPEGKDFAVCIDSQFAGMGDPEGEALFDAEGNQTEVMKNVLGFLSEYQGHINRTRAFMQRLRELKLLEGKSLVIKEGEQSLRLQGFYAVEEAKLNQLSDEEITRLYRDGFLGWIYAHLLSLGQVQQLHERK